MAAQGKPLNESALTQMDNIEKGKHVISAAKNLKRFQVGDRTIAALLYAASHAGRAGLLASALRRGGQLALQRVYVLAAEEGFGPHDVRSQLVPWLEASGLCRIHRRGPDLHAVESVVLGYDALLEAIGRYYDSLSPTPEDLATIHVLRAACAIPTPESEVLHAVASVAGEEKAKVGVRLAKSYGIVAHRSGKGLNDAILYSERVWAKSIGKASGILTSLDNTQRAVLLEMVERVRKYQGLPEAILREWATGQNADHTLDLAIGVGLLNRTEIQMADGSSRLFLTSPHFYADMGDEYGDDMCDRVKIFLDSTRNGQHFGHPWTGRIADPDRLLQKLLNTGELGPCTAIGTDWVTSERAGIVRVRRAGLSSGQFYMQLVQDDVVSKVHEIVTAGQVDPSSREMQPSHIREGSRFGSIEQLRGEAGELPASIAEAERAIILKLRES